MNLKPVATNHENRLYSDIYNTYIFCGNVSISIFNKLIMTTKKKENEYEALCSEPDCYNVVKEDDIERDVNGNIYERSKKCWDCRTLQDRKAIKAWRKKHKS